MTKSSTPTSPTLLIRLRDLKDEGAWNEFVDRYAPKIYGWCRRYGLQEADATDITQDVLTKMLDAMREFEYRPDRGSFRGWLKTVTNNAVRDLMHHWSRPERGAGDTGVMNMIAGVQSPDAIAELISTIDSEAETEMLREAEACVRFRVHPHTWQAYVGTVSEARPAPEVAKRLGLDVADIYVAKSRVIKMLREEVKRLQGSGTGDS